MSEKWEDQLDTALRGLIDGIPPIDDTVRARGRAALVTKVTSGKGSPMSVTESRPVEGRAEGPGKRPRRGRWLAAAATVAAVAGGLIVVAETTGPDGDPQTVTAAQILNLAASNVQELRIGEGQYDYVRSHFWGQDSSSGRGPGNHFVWQTGLDVETWIPYDMSREWMLSQRRTGERKWLVGTEEDAKEQGIRANFSWPEGTWKGDCGMWAGDERAEGPMPMFGCGKGSWREPTREWAAALPRDPELLLARLRADTPREGDFPHDASALENAAAALRSGVLPPDLRSALYEAIAQMPDIEITEDKANLDGRKGTALGIEETIDRFDIIVDQSTGEFIGERRVRIKENPYREVKKDVDGDGEADDTMVSGDDIPVGTVVAYTAVTTGIVDEMGQQTK